MTAHRNDYARKEDPHQYRAVMLCSVICFTRTAKTSNFIPSSLGLYLQGSGVKRRVLSTMAGLGLCISYNTIARNMEQINEAAKESNGDFCNSSNTDT
jgi:hypothetical protein